MHLTDIEKAQYISIHKWLSHLEHLDLMLDLIQYTMFTPLNMELRLSWWLVKGWNALFSISFLAFQYLDYSECNPKVAKHWHS